MLYGGGIFGVAILVLWVWAVLDVISTDESLCRNLPKTMWLMVVIFLSGLGALAWLLLGRPENTSLYPGSASPRGAGPRGLEDSPRWDRRLDDRTGVQETAREREERERRARYADLDAELDRRLEAKKAEEQRLAEWERQLSEREAELRRREQGRDDDR